MKPRRQLSNTQVVCIILLWGFLCYILLAYSKTINFDVIFALVCSGIVVFVPVYKNLRHRKDNMNNK